MIETFVEYPRNRNLPHATLTELLDMSDAREKALRALVGSSVLGLLVFALLVNLRPVFGDVSNPFEFILLCIWFVFHCIATFRSVKAVDSVTAPYREWQWTAPFSGLVFFFLPVLGGLVPLVVLFWTSRYFRVRGITLRWILPRHNDLVQWAEVHSVDAGVS